MDKPAATVAARLLVVDGEPSVAADVGSALEDLRCDVVAVGSGAEAVEALDGTFDLVLVDRRLPGSGCSEVIRRARHDGVSDVVLLSSDRAADTRREVLRLGADALVHKPIDPESLLGVVAPMLESDRTLDVIPELPRILVVDDDEMVRLSVEASLEEHYDVAVTGSPYEALQYLRTRPFEILITDLMMAEMPGLELIRSARTAQPLLIAIVMTGYASKRAAISSLQEGAYDLLEKPLTPALVRETVAKAWRSLRYRLENRRLLVSLRRTNEELRIARDAAQAANRAKSRFLANMSHELRTPLNGILGSLSLLEATVRFEPGQVDWVRQARESGETLLGLLSTVLDMAGAEAGVLELSQEPFGLAALFEDIGREWRARAPRRELQVDLAEDLPPRAKGDPRRLRQVLDQLLANAHRFTTEGR
ncbi:MAG: response regulator, partial [Acidobacteriota bacterium]